MSPVKIDKQHKFFDRNLNNDLNSLTSFLQDKMHGLENGLIPNITKEDFDVLENRSPATNLGSSYNVFQFHHEGLHNIYRAVSDMAKEACDYYGIDFDSQYYMIQGWFNFDNYQKPEPLPDSFLHDHLEGKGAPDFHGYYCVNAEPSNTYYKIGGIDGERFTNVNKNNRAVLSETGHPHGIQSWNEKDFRITIAYDVTPLETIKTAREQHWIPLI
jgi:hypothetical protein